MKSKQIKHLSKVWMNIDLFDHYTRGFLEAVVEFLTPTEIEYLPFATKLMTFECGMRFLTDYFNADIYFKIHREGHNLDRCHTQFKLVADMEEKFEKIVWTCINPSASMVRQIPAKSSVQSR